MSSKLVKKLALLLIFLFSLSCFAQKITITVVYNNVTNNNALTTDWGLSCFIEGLGKNILFDTGGDGAILLNNMKKLKIDPLKIDYIVLSHIHADHTGGLWDFLKKNNRVIVYLPQSFPDTFKEKAKMSSEDVVFVRKPVKIGTKTWSTGELGTGIKEQSLVIDTKKGLVIITGCAHPGIVNIVKFAKDYFNKEIYLVLGGFHLLAYNESQIKEIIKQLKGRGVKKVGPSHCTGGKAIELFREQWGKDFFDLGCGAYITIE